MLDTVIDFPVAQVVQVLPRRCAEAVPTVQTVRLTMDIPSGSTRWPMSLLCTSSWITGADSRDLTAAPWWSWVDGWIFWGPVHRYRAGGRVHRDTAPIIRCIQERAWTDTPLP